MLGGESGDMKKGTIKYYYGMRRSTAAKKTTRRIRKHGVKGWMHGYPSQESGSSLKR